MSHALRVRAEIELGHRLDGEPRGVLLVELHALRGAWESTARVDAHRVDRRALRVCGRRKDRETMGDLGLRGQAIEDGARARPIEEGAREPHEGIVHVVRWHRRGDAIDVSGCHD